MGGGWPWLFFLREALNSRAASIRTRFFNRQWSRSSPGGPLRRNCRLRRAPLLELSLHLLSEPCLLPVSPAIAQSDSKRKPRRCPDSNLRERKRRAEIKRHRQHTGRNDVGAGQIEVMDEQIT